MSPYNRSPRRHFADYQYNPYFKSNAYLERSDLAYSKTKNNALSLFKKIKKIFFRK